MRLLFTIPHYFHVKNENRQAGTSGSGLKGNHASITDSAEKRCEALRKTVMSIHQTFGMSQAMIRHDDRTTQAANESLRSEVHIIVVTAGGNHLMKQADFPAHICHQASIDDDPTTLGFHCHSILRDRWGNYDYYGYLEDDLSIGDAWFFEKLRWFNSHVGNGKVLLPNRFERSADLAYKKCYVDGDLKERVTKPFQNIKETPELKSTVLGRPIRFIRPLNPHSGCFFLNAQQMQTWIEQSHFGSRSTGFIGPLESAATLGIMKTFRIYKPAPENASFLEIEHFDSRFIRLIRIP